ncbi:hypothetical protein GDO78_002309 [Eleutherodactylus coqui]|uniref:Uncharacterized protein n=1 Tax=Eleutherodactylus coqui TaxID=57060 RepID=A0A8J6EY78_ELECQ|nr:hypothetical protein GDO78_002309 [Eleutherodactylus coqui]
MNILKIFSSCVLYIQYTSTMPSSQSSMTHVLAKSAWSRECTMLNSRTADPTYCTLIGLTQKVVEASVAGEVGRREHVGSELRRGNKSKRNTFSI